MSSEASLPLRIFTGTANTLGDGVAWTWGKAGSVINNGQTAVIPAALGAIGGTMGRWLSSGKVSGQMVMYQSAVGSLYTTCVVRRIEDYVAKNAGDGPNQFNKNAVAMLATAGAISYFAVPYLVTYYTGEDALSLVSQWVHMPKWMPFYDLFPSFQVPEGTSYDWKWALASTFLPAISQVVIEYLRKTDKKMR